MPRLALLMLGLLGLLARAESPLQVEVGVRQAKYCESRGSYSLHLVLAATYKNTFGVPLIMLREPQASEIVVSRNGPKGPEVEMRLMPSVYGTGDDPLSNEVWPNPAFITLAHEQVHRSTIESVVPVNFGQAERFGAAEGYHILQLLLSFWMGSDEAAARLRGDWHAHGLLWTTPLLSNRVGFEVKKPDKFEPCD